MIETEDLELRIRLEEITNRYIGEEPGRQIELIADLFQLYPHSIRIIREVVPGEPETCRFTCYQYAFDVVGSKRITKIARTYTKVYPNSEFVQYLIDHYLSEVSRSAIQDGDVIVYAQDTQIKHAGKIISTRVLSKWGLAHLWSHGTFEVPASYGSHIRYFQRIPRQTCIEAFSVYAKKRVKDLYGEDLLAV